ncbi:2-dehydropantoate 2-reductase [Brevibacillus humidisoli]|uniref:2-dehydropantoate 2-reductase n=1 Tax=Brevibacillus humidisoli TaxID=2895522 RepID=UPI001E595CFF|nr:2-dehydropantoate 2-reductase [Brevibacillus humidisoli]UFJ39773.1 2-dehydropantoate 2-reductase [Brevibacillus humidisoli]
MRVLVLGAGAVGGYFGGRLAEKGADVTFLVREKRRQQLAARGLRIHSVHGDAHIQPKLIVSSEPAGPFDLVILTMKAYHLDEGIESIRPYVGEQTTVLPLLNGFAHMERLQEQFGSHRVLGGMCFIESTLDENGDVRQTSKTHEVKYGEWDGSRTSRIEALQELFAGAKATYTPSDHIIEEMWNKYLFIVTLSGMTTLMNAPVGPIRDAEYGLELSRQLFTEAAEVMKAAGAPMAADIVDRQMKVFEAQGYKMKSSMLRDMEKGLPVEADHLQGYLLRLAEAKQVNVPLLRVVYHNLKVYELKRMQQI